MLIVLEGDMPSAKERVATSPMLRAATAKELFSPIVNPAFVAEVADVWLTSTST